MDVSAIYHFIHSLNIHPMDKRAVVYDDVNGSAQFFPDVFCKPKLWIAKISGYAADSRRPVWFPNAISLLIIPALVHE